MTKPIKKTHLQMVAEVLSDGEPRTKQEICDLMDERFGAWSKAQDRYGREGILSRVLSLRRLDTDALEDLEYDDGLPRIASEKIGGRVRWRLLR